MVKIFEVRWLGSSDTNAQHIAWTAHSRASSTVQLIDPNTMVSIIGRTAIQQKLLDEAQAKGNEELPLTGLTTPAMLAPALTIFIGYSQVNRPRSRDETSSP